MITYLAKLFTRRFCLFCSVYLAASPALAYWINFIPDNLQWSLEYTKSDTPEGAARRRCEIQYHGTKPLDRLWFVEAKDGHSIYGFTCGNIYTIPSHNTVRWYACPLDGHAYSTTAKGCVPIEQICGEGGYTYVFGRCLNRNLGSSSCPTTPLVGNPINAATGNKLQIENDISLPNAHHLHLKRIYNSLQISGSNSLFANNWRSNFDASIEYQRAWGMHRAILHRPDGNTLFFELHNNIWTGPKNAALILQSTTDVQGNISRWSLIDAKGNVEEFDAEGLLVSVTNPQSGTTTLTYDADGRLVTAEDPHGRTMQFFHDEMGRLIEVTDAIGLSYQYRYDDRGNLSELLYPDDTPAENSDNPRRTYRYDDDRFPTHLTAIVDERGHPVATWTFDEKGRATSSQRANGTNHYLLTYNSDGTTTVTDPLGHVRHFEFSDQMGRQEVASISGGECGNCSAQTAKLTYDSNGYVASLTDHNGNTVRYERDALGRELVRTEAFGTPEERTVTTSWHPVFGGRSSVAEPGRLTTYSYDPQGRAVSSTVRPHP